MKRLFEIDLKDYKSTDVVFRRPSARAIIFKDNKLALVYSKKEKYYKFPGGGIHDDEDKKEALIREVREEVGLVVIPESIREYGSVLRRQKSTVRDGEIFEQENYYYFCDVQDKSVGQELDAYEDEAGFELRIVDVDDAIATNAAYTSDDYFNEIMIKRDKRVLEMIKQSLKQLPELKAGAMSAKDGKMKISELTPGYDLALADLIRSNLKKHHLDIPGTVYFDDNLNHLSDFYLADPNGRYYYVVTDDTDKLIGGIGLAEFEFFENCCELQKLYLSDEFKGAGLSYKLISLIEDKAKELGYKRMYLETHDNLAAAIHVYEKCGYKEIEKPAGVVHATMNRFFIKEL